MAEIVVQGEHYKDADELASTITGLEDKADQLPSESPQRAALYRHIGEMREAMPPEFDWDKFVREYTGEAESESEPEPEPEPDDAAPTTDLRVAAETGAPLACPTCGQEVPFPESPPLDTTVKRCENCDGWGKVVRPTRVDGQIWHDCPVCLGDGFLTFTGDVLPVPVKVRAAAAPKWGNATWDADNEWWNPGGAKAPWDGARWDHLEGAWV